MAGRQQRRNLNIPNCAVFIYAMTTTLLESLDALQRAGVTRLAVWLSGWQPRLQVFDLQRGSVVGLEFPIYPFHRGSDRGKVRFSTSLSEYKSEKYPDVEAAVAFLAQEVKRGLVGRAQPRNAAIFPKHAAERRRKRLDYNLEVAEAQVISPDVVHVQAVF